MVDPATVNPALVVSDPEDSTFTTFVLKLMVENRNADAQINPPVLVPSCTVASTCGFIEYPPGDTAVRLPFEARQNREFARYRF